MDVSNLPSDVLVSIALQMNLPTLTRFCQSSKRFNNLTCNSFSFWFNKLKNDYGFTYSKEKVHEQFYSREKLSDIEQIKRFYRMIYRNNDLNYNLMIAASLGDVDALKFSLDRGANIHVGFDQPLVDASRLGHLDAVKYLVERGANIHVAGEDPLNIASRNGHLKVVKYLYSKGANIHAGDNRALINASISGDLNIVKYLVEKGADIHARNDYVLKIAKRHGHTDVVKYLIEQGAVLD